MKIAVYAIARDEAKFAERWYASMKEADAVFVLDTGSRDGTPYIMRKLGATVAVHINEPFRFDRARNASLALVPHDFDWCICTDIDEVFQPGWRAKVEAAAAKNPACNSMICDFVTAFDDKGEPVYQMDFWKIHRRKCVHWEGLVHEYLVWDKPRVIERLEGIRLEHHPDPDKPRTQYLPMLEAAVKEERSPRTLFYYGRELMFYNRFAAAVAVFGEYLAHPCSTWNAERAWAMRYIARCVADGGDFDLAGYWYAKAAVEAPDQRESLVELARMCAGVGDYDSAVRALEIALTRKVRPTIFFTDSDCWDGTPERLLAEYKQKQGGTK